MVEVARGIFVYFVIILDWRRSEKIEESRSTNRCMLGA